jgi:HEAT repeat protein/MFS-type transporter involved in bile tolerance (Atg22 family)
MIRQATNQPYKTRDGTLNRLEVMRGLRVAIWEGSFATVFGMLTSGSVFLTGFALMLGASTTQIGLLASFAALSGLTQLICPYYAARASSRRVLCLTTSYPGRMLWVVILCIPFMHFQKEVSVWLLLVVFAISTGLLAFAAPAWTAWMADLVPVDQRGRYFGQRSMICGIAGMAALLISGFYKDAITRTGDAHSQALSFSIVFAIGCVFAAAGWIALSLQPEPPACPDPPLPVAEMLRLPFRLTAFRRLALFFAVWVIGVTLPAPYFSVYMIENLKLSYSTMNFQGVVAQLGGLISLPIWGFLSDKFGNRPIVVVCTAIAATLPLPWLLATPHNAVYVLSAVNLVSGVIWNGLALAQFNMMIAVTPQVQRQIYFAAIAAISGLANFAAPLFGAGFLALSKSFHGSLFGIPLVPMELLFIMSAMARALVCVFAVPRLQEPRSHSAGDMLQQIASADPVRTALYLRGARQVSDPEKRAESIEKLGALGSTLAVDELVPTLQDPSLHVRREAARALGLIRDDRAVDALGEALLMPALGVSEQAARSLGLIGSSAAMPFLRLALQEPHRPTQMAVLRAMGEIGGQDAEVDVQAALERAREEQCPEVAEAACLALGAMGSVSSQPTLIHALADPNPRIRAVAASALAELSAGPAHPELVTALEKEDDSVALGALAEAVAQVRSSDSLPGLRRALLKADSPVLRRQIALALATILASRADAYALLAAPAAMQQVYLSRFLKQRCSDESPGRENDILLQAFEAGDYRSVIEQCSRMLPPDSDTPESRFVRNLARQTGYDPFEEEALVCMMACASKPGNG